MVTQLMGLGWVGVMLTFVTRRGHSNRGFNCIFFACFHLSSFQSIGPWFPFACCRHSFTSQPPPTCKVCFLKTFLWEIWIGCLVFGAFVNDLLRALTVAQGRQSRQRKRPLEKKKASQKLQIASKHWFMLPRLANSVEKEDGSVRPEAQICGNSHKWSRRLWKKGAFSKGSLTTPYPSFTRIDRDVINFFASLCWPTVQMKWKWYLSSV